MEFSFGYSDGFYYDPLMIPILAVMLLAIWAQFRVQSTFRKYADVMSQKGLTAAQVAEDMMRNAGIQDVTIARIGGHLTDNYDPRAKVLSLSADVHDSASLSALGVAAHEVGHVMQHYENYAPLRLRSMFVPVAQVGSWAAVPLFFLGLLLSFGPLMWVGIAVFFAVVLFYVVTLPVEFNASSRAIASLEAGGYLTYQEARPAKKVLNAAGLTYVMAALQAFLQLIRLLSIAGRRRD